MNAPTVTNKQKLVVLLLLVIQNATVSLMARYSRGILKEKYLNTSVVIIIEIFKLVISSLMIINNKGDSYLNNKPWTFIQKLIYLIKNSGYSWIPAGSYFIQNTLQYVALQNLTAAVYACLQQLKIISAAIFSVIILGKRYHIRKWRALILLTLGGILMEYHTFELHESGQLTDEGSISDPIIGTIAILSIVLLSGFAGVITQKLLQNKGGNSDIKLSVWDRNLQLSFWSLPVGVLSLLLKDRQELMEIGFFGNWTINTCIIVLLYGIGGILVAITIKYTDVVVKGFASAISLICICIFGSLMLGDTLDIIFTIGAAITVIATFNYSDNGNTKTSPTNVAKHSSNNDNNESERASLMNGSTKK